MVNFNHRFHVAITKFTITALLRLAECFLCIGCTKHLEDIISFHSHISARLSSITTLHVINEYSEAQRGSESCPHLHSRQVAETEFQSASPKSVLLILGIYNTSGVFEIISEAKRQQWCCIVLKCCTLFHIHTATKMFFNFLSLFLKHPYFSINKKIEKWHQPFFLQTREHVNLTFPLHRDVVNTGIQTYIWTGCVYTHIPHFMSNMGHIRVTHWANRLIKKNGRIIQNRYQ